MKTVVTVVLYCVSVFTPSSKPGGPHTEKFVMFAEWPWDRGATDGTIEESDDE